MRAKPSVRLDTLTGLRFVAAFLVFGSHLDTYLTPQTRQVTGLLFDQGRAGVSFFFVLSGFVLAWSRSERHGPGVFYRNRFARIWPAFFVAWIVGTAVAVLAHNGITPAKFLLGAALMQDWVPDDGWYFAANGVSWSLSCELVFYLLYPLLVAGLRRVSPRVRWTVAGVMVAVPVLLAVWGQVEYTGHGYAGMPNTVAVWAVTYLPLSRVPEFVIGVVLALEAREGRWVNVGWWPALVLAAAAYLAAGVWPSVFSSVAVVLVPFALLISAGAARDVAGRRTAFTLRPVVWLGEVSFAFYLVHQLVVRVYGNEVRHTPDVVAFVVTLAGSVAAAAGLHYLVERPCYRLLKGSPNPVVEGVKAANWSGGRSRLG